MRGGVDSVTLPAYTCKSMRHRFLALSSVSLAAVLLSGCLTTQVSLDYEPNPANMRMGDPVVSVGGFRDNRGEEPRLIGTVKTLIGTPFERVYLKVTTEEAVQNAFMHALSARGMMAPPSKSRFALEGTIEDLYCQLVTKPYAYARLNVDLVDVRSNRVLYRHSYEAERQSATFLPGQGDPVPTLRGLTSTVLQDAVDRAIDDPLLREWMGNPERTDGPGHPKNAKRKTGQ